MLLVDGAVGSDDGGLDVAKCGVDPFEGGRPGGGRAGACLDDLVTTPGCGDGGEAGEAIADDLTVGAEATFGEA